MERERLVIKFPFLRRRQWHSEPDLSRSTKWVRAMKERNPEKYAKLLEKDRGRKLKEYVPVSKMNDDLKEKRREKERLKKRKQRAKSKEEKLNQLMSANPDETASATKSTKSPEEIREYNKKKKRQSRCRQRRREISRSRSLSTTATPVNPAETADGERPAKSRRTIQRKARSLSAATPTSPREYASVVKNLLDRATPRKKRALQKIGIQCSFNTEAEINCIEHMKGRLVELRSKGQSDETRKFLRTLSQISSKYGRNLLGLSWRTRKAGKKRLVSNKRKLSSGARILRPDTAAKVEEFWLSGHVSRQLPLKKRVKKGKPMFLLETTYTGAYKKFNEVHPEIRIKYTKFLRLKPTCVRLMKAMERIVCCCIKCENIKLMAKGLNNACRTHEVDRKLEPHAREISEFTMCSYDQGSLPQIKCVERSCEDCGPKEVKEFYKPLLDDHGDDDLTYEIWEKVQKTTKKGKNTEVIELVSRSTTVKSLVEIFVIKLQDFSAYLFRAAWQQEQLKKCKDKMKPKSAVLIVDYAENYSCTAQDEVQSAHWSNTQATIHPVMSFVNDKQTSGPFTNKSALIFISDDRKHNADGVNCFMSKTYPYLQEKFGVTHFERFSDCCAGQYRCGKAFNDIYEHPTKYNSTLNHNYFESSHGKSCADGLAAVVKNHASAAVSRRQVVIRNAKELHAHCNKELSKQENDSERVFFYVDSKEVDNSRPDYKTIPGTMKVHSATAGTLGKIKLRNLSCLCDSCRDNKGTCKNLNIVGDWRVRPLKRKGEQDEAEGASEPTRPRKRRELQLDDEEPIPEIDSVPQNLRVMPDGDLKGQWCLVRYDGKGYPGIILAVNETIGCEYPFLVKAMHPTAHGRNQFFWPKRDDTLEYAVDDVIAIIPELAKTTRYHILSAAHFEIISQMQ